MNELQGRIGANIGDEKDGLEMTRCKREACVEQSRKITHMDLLYSREESQVWVVENVIVSVEKPGWKPNCLSVKKSIVW